MIEAVTFRTEPNDASHWNLEDHGPEWRGFGDSIRIAGDAVHAENPALPRGRVGRWLDRPGP